MSKNAERLYKAARDAMAMSHAPYSEFPVGAAILAENGQIFGGCNIENASYPEGWCAETSAIANMIGNGQTKIVAIAVIAEKKSGATPCGGCRQRIAEFANADIPVHLCNNEGVIETIRLEDLLPRSFDLDQQVKQK